MATVTAQGVTPTTLEGYVSQLETVFKSVFGEDLNVDPETPQGQLIGSIALIMSNADEALVRQSNATSIYRSFSQQIDGLASILSISRNAAQRSVVTATLTGVPSTLILAGTRAVTDDNNQFRLINDVQLPGSGAITATMESVEVGPIPAPAGSLTHIVDVVPGWETVTNASDATLGRPQEIDTLYRRRYFQALSRNALTPIAATESAVSDVTGVSSVLARENDTAAPVMVKNITIPANSIWVAVEGGADNDIGSAIRSSKTAGIPTDGTTTVNVPHPRGFDTPIKFTRVRLVSIEVELDISTGPAFPGNGINLIKDRIIEYVTGIFPISQEGFFETDGLLIAEDLNKFRLFTPINSVAGHTVNSLSINVKGNGAVDTIVTDLDQRITIDNVDDITITVTT